MKSNKLYRAVIGFLFAALSGGNVSAADVLIDFESPDVPAGINTMSGDTFNSYGVSFSTVSRPTTATPTIGGVETWSAVSSNIIIYDGSNAYSGSQFIGPQPNGNVNDLLMAFSTPITRISIFSDQTPEAAQTIRLIALDFDGSDYKVLGFYEAADNLTGLASKLEVDTGSTSFSYALFEVTTEQEGFDDLSFTTIAAVPEPEIYAMLGMGLGLIGWAARRRRAVPAL